MANKTGQFAGRCPNCQGSVYMRLVPHDPRPLEKQWKGRCENGHLVRCFAETSFGSTDEIADAPLSSELIAATV